MYYWFLIEQTNRDKNVFYNSHEILSNALSYTNYNRERKPNTRVMIA
jgi:hypothetical protein